MKRFKKDDTYRLEVKAVDIKTGQINLFARLHQQTRPRRAKAVIGFRHRCMIKKTTEC